MSGFSLRNSPRNLLLSGYLCIVLLLINSDAVAVEKSIVTMQPANVHLSFETLALPENESMGLAGVGYSWLFANDLELGITAFGAVTGERGGFFTGGVEIAKAIQLLPLVDLRGGLFIGGGGGGGAPQGGGLMLRPHLDIRYRCIDDFYLGASLSHIMFPNGEISSTQLGIFIEKPFAIYLASAAENGGFHFSANQGPGVASREIALSLLHYYPSSSAIRKTSGARYDGPIHLVGTKLRQAFNQHGFFSLTTHGAYKGDVDGYAEVFGGVGYRANLGRYLEILAELNIGAGGGGAVNTGGGGLWAPQISLQYLISPSIEVYAEIGRVMAFDGEFTATSAGLGIAYRYNALLTEGTTKLGPDDVLDTHFWRLHSGIYRYLPYGDTRRKNGRADDRPIDLVAAGIDFMLNQYSYLTGQGYSAVDADAGGYSAGQVGLGIQSPPLFAEIVVGAELTMGAAGGGGIAVGNGIVIQPTLFIDKQCKNILIRGSAGRFYTANGTFNANLVGIQLGYQFSTLFAHAD